MRCSTPRWGTASSGDERERAIPSFIPDTGARHPAPSYGRLDLRRSDRLLRRRPSTRRTATTESPEAGPAAFLLLRGEGGGGTQSRPDLLRLRSSRRGSSMCLRRPLPFQPIRHTIPALASSQRGGMLRQDQGFGERAAFRWADWTMIALMFLTCPGCRSGRLPHRLPRILSQHGSSATCNVLLTETDSRPRHGCPGVAGRVAWSPATSPPTPTSGAGPDCPLGRRDPTAEGEVTRGGTPQPHNPTRSRVAAAAMRRRAWSGQ